jgi:hypothetical protein
MAAAKDAHGNRPRLQERLNHRVLALRLGRRVGDYLAVLEPGLGRVPQLGVVQRQHALQLADYQQPQTSRGPLQRRQGARVPIVANQRRGKSSAEPFHALTAEAIYAIYGFGRSLRTPSNRRISLLNLTGQRLDDRPVYILGGEFTTGRLIKMFLCGCSCLSRWNCPWKRLGRNTIHQVTAVQTKAAGNKKGERP